MLAWARRPDATHPCWGVGAPPPPSVTPPPPSLLSRDVWAAAVRWRSRPIGRQSRPPHSGPSHKLYEEKKNKMIWFFGKPARCHNGSGASWDEPLSRKRVTHEGYITGRSRTGGLALANTWRSHSPSHTPTAPPPRSGRTRGIFSAVSLSKEPLPGQWGPFKKAAAWHDGVPPHHRQHGSGSHHPFEDAFKPLLESAHTKPGQTRI